MRVQVFSDIHSDLAALERNRDTPADLYLCAGDLCNWGRGLDACGEILRPLGDKLWVMPGNHETDREIADFCKKFGFQNFHRQSFELGGWHFAGLGYSNPTPFDTPGESSEEELAERLAEFADLDPLVLVCHAPPLQTPLDAAGPDAHFGSRAVREFVERHKPKYLFCGHIHEAAGADVEIGETRGVNVGKRGFLLEL